MNKMTNYPMLAARTDTLFVRDLQAPPIQVSRGFISRGVWNLILSKRDLTMWVKCKIKPNRNWKVSQVKTYFGLTGSGQKLLDQLVALKEEVDSFLVSE